MSVLACLAAGFDIVARHPLTVSVPLLLDLFLWLGPRLSLAPFFLALDRFFKEAFSTEARLCCPTLNKRR